ncbi:MAG TPA: tetratricopeptide repeat protein, partial [Ktedonobacteraceae bacterium]|nr:tetratricopeptide repeat protein [Ktedonobacteraceae bacterium]
MNITPLIPDGYNGPIKQLTCRICQHVFYLTQDDYHRLPEVRFCHECSLILLEELQSLQGVNALPPPMAPKEQPVVVPPTRASVQPSPPVRVPPPRTIDRGKMTVEQLLEEAAMLRKTWRYQEALASYEQALQRDPDCIAAHQGRCAMLRELGRRQEALLAYDELVRLDPLSANTWVGKGWVLAHLKRYEEALAAFDHALQRAPSLGTAMSGKRFILEHLHRDEEAEALAQPDTTRTDRQPLAAQHCTTADDYYRRGEALLSLDQEDEAMRAFEACLGLDPLYLDAYARISRVHFRRDEHQRELSIWNRALQLVPESAK